MPEKSGTVFDSKMSASLQLRNDSEADTTNASVIKPIVRQPRRRNLAGLFYLGALRRAASAYILRALV